MKTRNLRRRTLHIEHSTTNTELPDPRRPDHHSFSDDGWTFDIARSMLLFTLLSSFFLLSLVHAQASAVFTTLYSFSSTNDGANPQAALVQGSDGDFYGTTFAGGTNGDGTVFKISTNGSFTRLYSFTGGTDGEGPVAGLVDDSDGNFYGTTSVGGIHAGTNGYGTVFQISTNGVLTGVHSFTGFNDGAYPQAALVQGSDGYFYGTTYAGGAYSNQYGGFGTVFKINNNGALTNLHSFSGGNDGGYPAGGLAQGTDGNFYGTTVNGGTNGSWGSVFKITTNGTLTSLHSFSPPGVGSAGPSGLMQGSDGYFYGTTFWGGVYGYGDGFGTAFQISTNGALTNLYLFLPDNDVEHPHAGLVQGSDGNFYGTTGSGGTNSYGTVFKITPNGALTSLYSFTNGIDGSRPECPLVQGSDGSFYGTSSSGGFGGAGTIFRLTIMPEFQAVTLTNSTLSLTWSTEAGGRYQLQCNSNLSSSNWINLNSPVTATGATLSTTDSVTNTPQRFYRLVLLQ
jgi:uncharacterized repeat protein (TIGR03803 family)